MDRSLLGNALVGAVLAVVAIAFLRLHGTSGFMPVADPLQWGIAGTCVVAYAAWAGWAWRKHRAERTITAEGTASSWWVAYASQTGFARELAVRTVATLRDAGCTARLCDLGQLDSTRLAGAQGCLFIASTTGEGDPPDHALAFVRDAMSLPPPAGVAYAVLALGDRSYDNFCAFGHRLERWLREGGARPLFDLVEVDNGDPGALRHWQHHLGVLSGVPELPDWAPARYEAWRLVERMQANPGCESGEAFHVALEPMAGATRTWLPGDIAEIGPRNDPDSVARLLDALGLDANATPDSTHPVDTLSALLSRSHLPRPDEVRGLDAVALSQRLEPLPHREYSIASIASDGRIELLLRRMLRPDGTAGLGSGWLCDHAPPGATVDLRIRSNPNFHPPHPSTPMILVGNGTGMAGLRAHLNARIEAGARRNWLVFGERHAAHDLFYAPELAAWQADGWLERLDLAFSRDGGPLRYVQHALAAQTALLREWIDAGAAVYVCGSLRGMAPGVDDALRTALGAAMVDELAVQGRYRRDVY